MPLNGGLTNNPALDELLRQQQEMIRDAERRRAERARDMEAAQEAMREQRETWTINGSSMNISFANLIDPYQVTKADVAKTIENENQKEIERLERFIKTGEGNDHVYADENDTLFMTGMDRKPTHIMFVMDKTSIVAQKDRSKHLKPLLKELAKREGLELTFVKDMPDLPNGFNKLRYIAFKHRVEVDDTELVISARPRNFRDRPEYEPCDNCGHCGDPNCSDCSHCGECEPDMFDDDEEEDYDEDGEDW